MNTGRLKQYVDKVWDDSIVPSLCDYIRIPNKSQNFDPQWAEHGHMDRAAELMRKWCEAHALAGMKVEIQRLACRDGLLLTIRRDRAVECIDENPACRGIFDAGEELARDTEAGSSNAAGHPRVNAFTQDFYSQRADEVAAKRGRTPELIVVAAFRVQTDDKRWLADAIRQRIDIGR